MSEVKVNSQRITFESNIIQLLVRNYLQHENKSINYYDEIIHDIDGFKTIVDNIMKTDNINVNFIQVVGDEYLEGFEVKYAKVIPFEAIRQLIGPPYQYPPDMKLNIIFVPLDGIHYSTKDFQRRKDSLLILNHLELASELMNPNKNKKPIAPALDLIYHRIVNNKSTPMEDAEMAARVVNNFKKIDIKVLQLSELLKYPLTEKSIRDALCRFDD